MDAFEGDTLAMAGSAGKVHSELEQVQQQMADTPLFAPEVEAALEVMYHRLLKKKDEGQQTSFVLGQDHTAKQDTPPSPESAVTPARSQRSSVPRSRSGKSPARSPQWDPYFSRGEPATPQHELQNQLVVYYDKHNHEIEKAERRLEAELRGIDGQLRKKRSSSRPRASHSPSPQRTYQMCQAEKRPKKANYKSPSPRSERTKVLASPGYAAHTPPTIKQPNLYDTSPRTPQDTRPIQPPLPGSSVHSPVYRQPEQAQPPQRQSPLQFQALPRQSVAQQQVPRPSPARKQVSVAPPDTPIPQVASDVQFSDIEAKLRHIREQLGSPGPKESELLRAQSVPAAFPQHAPRLARLQSTSLPHAGTPPPMQPSPQPDPQQPRQRPESPTIQGPNVDSVLDMLQRSKAARKENIVYDPRHQPPPMPANPMRAHTPPRSLSPKKGSGRFTPAKSVMLQEPKKSSPPQLSIEEVIQRTHTVQTPSPFVADQSGPEVSAVSLATSTSTAHGPITDFVQDMPPPVPSPPMMSPRSQSVLPDTELPNYSPSVRPHALPKSSYNARRKWEHVSYSDDATRRLMALKDEAKEYATETQAKVGEYTKSLARQVTETMPQQLDKTESELVEYPPPPQHHTDMDRTEAEDTTGAQGIIDGIRKKFETHKTSGESMLYNVKNIDSLVGQKELEERTMPEVREENVKEGCLRTLRRGKGQEKDLTWKDVWVEADNRELRFYPIHESKHGRGREKPLGRVKYSEAARLAEDLGNDGVYFYFGLERHSDAKVSIFTLCTSSHGSRRSWCTFLRRQMQNADSIRLGQLPTTWSHEQPYEEIEP